MTETQYFGQQGAPLVVVLHDWFGIGPWLTDVAIAIASEGFQVALPDFLDGRTAGTVDEARELVEAVDVAASLAVIDDIIDEARLYGTERVGLLGFSTGGWLALVHAQGGEVDAAVAYYASVSERHHGIIPCPVLLQLAENDAWEYGSDPEAFFERLSDHGTPVTHFSYFGTRHHFANAGQPQSFDRQAAALALARTTAFLSAHLDD